MQKPDLLSSYRSTIQVNIAWGDMDAAQHVNNIMYLRYLESACIQYLDDIGFSFAQSKTGIILAEINCKYRIPLTFPDVAWVGTKAILDTMDVDSIWTEQIIVSQNYQRIATICKAKLVCYHYISLQKAAWPEDVIAKLRTYEQE
jgi:acyl-CoA thioester hydrolase